MTIQRRRLLRFRGGEVEAWYDWDDVAMEVVAAGIENPASRLVTLTWTRRNGTRQSLSTSANAQVAIPAAQRPRLTRILLADGERLSGFDAHIDVGN